MSDQATITRTDQRKGSVVIDAERCKGCGLCVEMCPKRVLAISRHLNSRGCTPAEAVSPEQCTGCTLCAVMCPDAAIKVCRRKKGVHNG